MRSISTASTCAWSRSTARPQTSTPWRDEFELTVHSRWRERDRQDDLTLTHFDCRSPALAEGVWTVVFGDEELRLFIPREQEPVVCTPGPQW